MTCRIVNLGELRFNGRAVRTPYFVEADCRLVRIVRVGAIIHPMTVRTVVPKEGPPHIKRIDSTSWN